MNEIDKPYSQQLAEANMESFGRHVTVVESLFNNPPFVDSPLLSMCLYHLLILTDERWQQGREVNTSGNFNKVLNKYLAQGAHSPEETSLLENANYRATLRAALQNFVSAVLQGKRRRQGGIVHTKSSTNKRTK